MSSHLSRWQYIVEMEYCEMLFQLETEKHANSFVAYCKYTATYLDNYSSFGVMFYLKKKNDEFAAFKQYKVWAE